MPLAGCSGLLYWSIVSGSLGTEEFSTSSFRVQVTLVQSWNGVGDRLLERFFFFVLHPLVTVTLSIWPMSSFVLVAISIHKLPGHQRGCSDLCLPPS